MLDTYLASYFWKSNATIAPFIILPPGYLAIGADPPTTGPIRVDTASYGNIALHAKGGAASSVRLEVDGGGVAQLIAGTGTILDLGASNSTAWRITNGGGIAAIRCMNTNARIIGGVGSGLAIRNNSDTRDNFSVNDTGNTASLNNGSNSVWLNLAASANGELPATRAELFNNTGGGSTVLAATSSGLGSVMAGYFNGAAWYSALEVANVAGGGTTRGILSLMRSGGEVRIGATSPAILSTAREVIVYSASMTPTGRANQYTITVTNTTAFTINAPTVNPAGPAQITIVIRNTSGGVMGAVTWNAIYKLAAFTNPANGFSRSITFMWDGTNYVEVNRSTADIPN